MEEEGGGGALEDGDEVMGVVWWWSLSCVLVGQRLLLTFSLSYLSLALFLLFSFSLFPSSGVTKKTCTGGGWRRSSTTGTTGAASWTEATPRAPRACWGSGPAFQASSRRARW